MTGGLFGWLFSSEPDARPVVHRDHWKTDLVTHVVMAVGWVAAGVSTAWLLNLSARTGLLVAAWVWLVWALADVAQAWVWRRGRL